MKFSLVIQAISLVSIGHRLCVASALDVSSKSPQLATVTANTVAAITINNEQPITSPSLLKRRTSEDDHDHKKKPWGQVIGFTLLVNFVTFVGVILLAIPPIRAAMNNRSRIAKKEEATEDKESLAENESREAGEVEEDLFFGLFVPSFACGALLATAIFLILPESIALLTHAVGDQQEDESHQDETHESHQDEANNHAQVRFLEGDDHDNHAGEIPVGAIWRFGASFLGGFLLPVVMTLFFPRPKKQDDNSEETSINYSIAVAILLGDFFHNFGDGVFIGIAFMLCDDGLAYTIAAVTVYHEIAQEIADFFLLTGFAGLSIFQALVVNFVSGLSVLLGGIFVLAMDVSDMAIGVILALSCGIYMYIACTESFPKARKNMITRSDFAVGIGSFLIGVIPIGLALINHSHC